MSVRLASLQDYQKPAENCRRLRGILEKTNCFSRWFSNRLMSEERLSRQTLLAASQELAFPKDPAVVMRRYMRDREQFFLELIDSFTKFSEMTETASAEGSDAGSLQCFQDFCQAVLLLIRPDSIATDRRPISTLEYLVVHDLVKLLGCVGLAEDFLQPTAESLFQFQLKLQVLFNPILSEQDVLKTLCGSQDPQASRTHASKQLVLFDFIDTTQALRTAFATEISEESVDAFLQNQETMTESISQLLMVGLRNQPAFNEIDALIQKLLKPLEQEAAEAAIAFFQKVYTGCPQFFSIGWLDAAIRDANRFSASSYVCDEFLTNPASFGITAPPETISNKLVEATLPPKTKLAASSLLQPALPLIKEFQTVLQAFRKLELSDAEIHTRLTTAFLVASCRFCGLTTATPQSAIAIAPESKLLQTSTVFQSAMFYAVLLTAAFAQTTLDRQTTKQRLLFSLFDTGSFADTIVSRVGALTGLGSLFTTFNFLKIGNRVNGHFEEITPAGFANQIFTAGASLREAFPISQSEQSITMRGLQYAVSNCLSQALRILQPDIPAAQLPTSDLSGSRAKRLSSR